MSGVVALQEEGEHPSLLLGRSPNVNAACLGLAGAQRLRPFSRAADHFAEGRTILAPDDGAGMVRLIDPGARLRRLVEVLSVATP